LYNFEIYDFNKKKINIRFKNELLTNLFENNIIYIKTVKKNYIDHKDEILNEKKLIKKYDNFSIYLYPKVSLSNDELENTLTIIFLGETGSGKTTLINSFVNFLLDIKYNDNKRFKLINESNKYSYLSKTQEVTVYNVKSHCNYPSFRLIDTPGFNDTDNITSFDKDKLISKRISNIFEKKITHLNAICFVSKATNTRITTNQKIILNKILNLFAKNVLKNFICMMTFSDGATPHILEDFKSSKFYNKIISIVGEKWYLLFNNSAIFNEEYGEMERKYYNLGMESFKEFFNKLKNLKKESMKESFEVQKKRFEIEEQQSEFKSKIEDLERLNNEYDNSYDKRERQYKRKEIKLKEYDIYIQLANMETNQIFLKDKALNAQNVLDSVEEFLEEQIDINEDEPILLNYIKDVQKNYNNLKNFYSDKYRYKNISFVDFLKNNRNEISYKSDVSMTIPNYPNKDIKKKDKKEKKDNGCIIF
jgi:ABC-type dipeptide/oligopeptide/nickel transport system ATPase component